jgi:broad specificity phosphatase PhoE
MKLFYVRHGKTQGNVEKKYVGRSQTPLISEGIEAAKTVGHKIIALDEHIDVI